VSHSEKPDVIVYRHALGDVSAGALSGFFEGWPDPPSPERLHRILDGSAHVVLALDGDRVVGFVNAVSDGVLAAFLPLLEVLPAYRRRGIGSELVRRILADLDHLYAVDLVCDEDVVPFYESLGLTRLTAMGRRRYDRQSGTVTS